ncbi:Hypothetical_protein [Hexamita inflata]|uniref:Hypothetical_protein n=1 Tax=Hexamita inflata TaxID=28002 RepID=A0AA86P6V2_9EUKA|nr:Hypothetical protein HINF_LOCUS20907 [Hexamita inflata]
MQQLVFTGIYHLSYRPRHFQEYSAKESQDVCQEIVPQQALYAVQFVILSETLQTTLLEMRQKVVESGVAQRKIHFLECIMRTRFNIEHETSLRHRVLKQH